MAETWGKKVAKWTKITDADEDKTASVMTDSQANDRLRAETRVVGDDASGVELEANVVTRGDGCDALCVDVGGTITSDLYIEPASLDGLGVTTDLGVNGGGTPKEFMISPSATKDILIEEMRIFGQGNGIKLGNWLSSNNALSNGLEIEIKSDNIITTFPILKTTADIKNKFAFGVGASGFSLIIASGRDDVIGVHTFSDPFVLRVAGSFGTDDYVKITVNDNMTSTQSELEFWVKGFEKDPI